RRALKQSLNVPAVRLLNRIGIRPFKQYLESTGFKHFNHKAKWYGLGLVLGGAGVNLMELTNAYATLASNGKYQSSTFYRTRQSSKETSSRIFSLESAYLVHNILKNREPWFNNTNFAYKTGTSANHRDAWTIAYNPEYTVGVWVGNFSGVSSKYLLGKRAAKPLAQKVFRILYKNKQGPWYKQPSNVVNRTVCASSGRLPNRNCPRTKQALFIKKRTQPKQCDVHQKIYVSPDGQRSYCSGCIRDHDYKTRVVERYSPVVTRFFGNRGMLKHEIPPHNSDCPYYKTTQRDLAIVSPAHGQTFVNYGDSKVPIKVAGNESNGKMFVFVNQKLLGKLQRDKTLFFDPDNPGKYTVSVVDYSGNSTQHSFTVR
ncbi:MAG: penicillin-binding transpeptidase domain-containing protein, partial [bacterium]